MPYIKKINRSRYKNIIKELYALDGDGILNKGDLEYIVFNSMMAYILTKGSSYNNLHDCTYAVKHCADEFKRRFLDVKEDRAIIDNGDINFYTLSREGLKSG